jgi:hypothetical protein
MSPTWIFHNFREWQNVASAKLFEAGGDLFGADPVPAYRPDPEKVRSRLHKILAEARAARKLPWEPTTVSLYQTIFPQMTRWLPEDEGAQLRFEFEAELERLKAA